MKKTLGYGFKLSSESFDDAIKLYCGTFLDSKREVKKEIKNAIKNKDIPKTSKPKIFRVIVETV